MKTFAVLCVSLLLVFGACGGFMSADDVALLEFDLSGPDHSASFCPDSFDPSMEGQPCAPDGVSCAHCPDICVGCTGYVCEGGRWKKYESFPAICG